jgi:hypothetical protein
MKKRLLIISLMLLSFNVFAQDPYTDILAEDLPVSDTKSSGCTSHSRGYGGEFQPTPTVKTVQKLCPCDYGIC